MLHGNLYLRGEIEFRGINFQYDNQKEWILKGITLKIVARTTYPIVGPIGSGKSTLASMLSRMIPVSDRSLFMDGVDINTMRHQRF